MRDILFRGKPTDKDEWVYGDLGHNKKGRTTITTAEGIDIEIIAKTVCQYTGITDRSGEEIFDSDIVNIYDNDDTLIVRNIQVVWNDRQGAWFLTTYDGYCEMLYPMHNMGYSFMIEGNYFDTPILVR